MWRIREGTGGERNKTREGKGQEGIGKGGDWGKELGERGDGKRGEGGKGGDFLTSARD